MSLLLIGDGDVTGVESVGISLTSGQMVELRRAGRIELVEGRGESETTVVIGHEDALDSLVEEVA